MKFFWGQTDNASHVQTTQLICINFAYVVCDKQQANGDSYFVYYRLYDDNAYT